MSAIAGLMLGPRFWGPPRPTFRFDGWRMCVDRRKGGLGLTPERSPAGALPGVCRPTKRAAKAWILPTKRGLSLPNTPSSSTRPASAAREASRASGAAREETRRGLVDFVGSHQVSWRNPSDYVAESDESKRKTWSRSGPHAGTDEEQRRLRMPIATLQFAED